MNKYAIWAVAIIFSFFAGRIMYLPLSGSLLGKSSSSAVGAQSMQEVKFGAGGTELRIKINLGTIKQNEWPKTVKLAKRVYVSTDNDDQPVALEKGSTVEVRGLDGESYLLKVSPGGPLKGSVPIVETDFAQQVIAYRARRHFGASTAVADNANPAPVPPPTLPPVAKNDPAKTPPPVSPAVDPAPKPAPEPAPA
ncbi:MAG TPA: hypothetical protein DD438_07740, partial [Verrucomicrobiales bacterium]|nr:hypothetical protein [Verrucomicrobiales bacterium]